MLGPWLSNYWWIPAVFAYIILLAIVMRILARRGTFGTTWPKITLAITCLIIVLIPAMRSPLSYAVATICVFNLFVLFRNVTSENAAGKPISSGPTFPSVSDDARPDFEKNLLNFSPPKEP